MSEKPLIVLIAVFVILAAAGVAYLLIFLTDTEGDPVQFDLESDAQPDEEHEVIGEIPDTDLEETASDPSGNEVERIETMQPKTRVGSLEGHVVSKTGAPVGGARVSLYKSVPGTPMKKREATHLYAETDNNGAYLIGSAPVGSNYLVFVEAEGYAGAELEGLTVRRDETLAVADIVLESGFMLQGTVTDVGGKVLSKVEVKAVDKMQEMMEMPKEVHSRVTHTDEGGKYALTCLTKSQYDIVFTLEEYRTVTVTQNFVLSSDGETPRVVDVQLDSGGLSIWGTVASLTGRPVANATITALFSDPRKNAHFSKEGKTDKQGRFQLAGLSEGHYTLLATAKGFYQDKADFAEAGEEVSISMAPTGAIDGRVRAASPLKSKYTVSIAKYTPSVRVNGKNRNKSAEFGPKPDFKYKDLLPGTYTFLVTANGYAQTQSDEIEVVSGETTSDVVIDLVMGGTITGTIADPGGKPLGNVKVQLMDKFYDPHLPFEEFFVMKPEQGKTTRTSGKGKFALKHVRAGVYTLKVEADKMASKVVKEVAIEEGGTNDIGVIRLSRGGRIEGVAFDKDGNPAPGAKISAMSEQAGSRKSTTTDKKGYFQLTSLAPGEYIVSMTPKDFWFALKFTSSVTVYVDENQTTRADIYTVPAEKKKKPVNIR